MTHYGPLGQWWADRHMRNEDNILTPEELNEIQSRLNQRLDHIREQEKIIAALREEIVSLAATVRGDSL